MGHCDSIQHSFDFPENLELPSRDAGFLNFPPSFLKNSGFPGMNHVFLSFLVGSESRFNI